MSHSRHTNTSVKSALAALSVLVCFSSYAQETKEFYNEAWERTDSIYAAYYRVINYAEKNKSTGMVRDYFITGELQWEGQFSYVDPENKYFDIKDGLCTSYYKNGKKQEQGSYTQGEKNGSFYSWFESGNAESYYSFYNDTLDGLCIEWFSSGLLAGYAWFDHGKLMNSESVLCNEFGECIKTFVMEFEDAYVHKKKRGRYYDYYDWYYGGSGVGNYDDYTFFGGNYYEYDEFGYPIYPDFNGFGFLANKSDVFGWNSGKYQGNTTMEYTRDGLKIENKSSKPFTHLMSYPVDYKKNFRISVEIDIEKAKDTTKQGLLFAWQDENNYMKAAIDRSEHFVISQMTEGKYKEIYRSASSGYDEGDYYGYYKYYGHNVYITIEKYMDSISFYADYYTGTKIKYEELKGTQIGIEVGGGSRVILSKLAVVEETDAPFVSADFDAKTASRGMWKGTGSGFVVSQDGYIVTNHHVIEDAKQVEIDILKNGEKVSYEAEVVMMDKVNDLAIIRVKDENFTGFDTIPYTLKTDLADVGTEVYALGYPLALSMLSDELKYTEGTISSRTGREGMVTAYQVSTPVQPGNSGGPLFDYEGNLLGVINEKIFYADNVAFAIKANYITNLTALLPENIVLPKNDLLSGKPATEQIKMLREFIPLIKVR